MNKFVRGFFLLSASVSVLGVAACGTTSATKNVSNPVEANRVDAILEKAARDAKAQGNDVETLALLEQLHLRNPDDAAMATGFGRALREDQQLNRARQVLAPHTEGKDAYPDAVTELAMVQLALGNYKEAELTARRAVELDPEQGRPYLALGTALDAQNYHEQAETAFRRGLDKWKGDPAPILNNLALNLASQNKLDQALDLLYRAKEESPGRMEIERNIRIISTLKEGADDFLKRPESEQTKSPVVKSVAKAETPAKKADVKAKADAKVDVKEKEAEAKPAEKKPAPKPEKKIEKKPVAKKEVPVKTSEKPPKTQNFNSNE